MPRTFWTLILTLLAAVRCYAQVDFAREVLPILSENCFYCHGPDDGSRKAGLRLDTKEGAFRTKREVTTLVPGKSGDSEVIRRILAEDDELMPPADSNRKLSAKQKDTLKKWVDEGAKWGTHWAYEKLAKTVPVPAVKQAAWGRTTPDAFVLAKLEQERLTPAAEATKSAWLRRVTLDLTGLPPTIAEADTFLADTSADAYERVVDRLLASPRYGERMATDWLDLARYADTHGYQSDRNRAMWAYRDWVIAAFNRNQKFDQFLTEQVAGDLLPNATKEQRLATAFNRLHMQNEEGGIVEEEFRVAYVVDRVNTFGTAFLGQTFECTRCHDHKYDPITQKDYYSLFAFFQNIDESGQTSYFTRSMNTPTLMLSTADQDSKIAELNAKISDAVARLRTARAEGEVRYTTWLKNRSKISSLEDDLGLCDFNAKPKGAGEKKPAGELIGKPQGSPNIIEGKHGSAIALNGENGYSFPKAGHFGSSDPFTILATIKAEILAPRAVVLHHSRAPIDAGSRGYELLLENGHVAFGLHHMWPGNSLKVRTKKPITVGEWTSIGVTYDGSSRAAGLRIFIDGRRVETETVADTLHKDITYGGEEPSLTIGIRFRDNGFKGGAVDDIHLWSRDLTDLEIGTLQGRTFFKNLDPMLRDYYFSAVDPQTRQCVVNLRDARRELAKYVTPIPDAMVMKELPKPKPAYVLKRGAYDSLGDPVTADTPKVLPPFPKDMPRNRLGLAKWLTQPDHPLTARVTVNRLWQQMFGRGLVETSDNFGTTGVPPTHPELLDWLARDFIDSGWDVKRMLKQLALSATYRQSSRTTPEVRAKDPFNTLLAHAPVRRLTAEMLRDQALFTSGLLAEKLGGPSVFPVQPAGLWDDAMGKPKYPQSKGDDLHRRSLYTHWKRTAPPPQMTTFDAADRANCAVKRQSTSTPLQALVLLNDPQMTEAATALAERMKKEKSLAEQIQLGFRTVTSRLATERELLVLIALHDEQKDGLVQVALAILNHDEAVNRR